MKIVQVNNQILAKHITDEDWTEGLAFFSADEDFIQVGTWRYDSGKQLAAHIHNEAERIIAFTQEVLFIRKGRIAAQIYDYDHNKVDELICEAGDVLILLAGGHGYTILEDDTRVLEIKNGPYLGAEADRRRI